MFIILIQEQLMIVRFSSSLLAYININIKYGEQNTYLKTEKCSRDLWSDMRWC